MNYKGNLLKTKDNDPNKLKLIDNVDEFLKENGNLKKHANLYNSRFSLAIQDIDTQEIVNHFSSIKNILIEYGFMNNFEVSDFFDAIKYSLISIEEFDETSDEENNNGIVCNTDDNFIENMIYDECFYF